MVKPGLEKEELKREKTRKTQAPGPETVNSQELEPEPELEPGSRPVPETRTSQEPGPWSTRLRPRHSAGRGRP